MNDSPRLDELKRRVQRDPASISFAALAEEYRRLGRFDEAIATCRAGLQRHPAYVSARVTLGRALLEMGDYDSAAVELEQVLQVAPENLAAIRALAEIHRRRGEMPEVVPVMEDDVEPAPAPQPPIPVVTSEPARIAVKSLSMPVAAHPALAGLESFLTAIQRARREIPLQVGR
jgi:tetratricopeptide (TPR) repeat protein